jgi:surface antigen
MRRRDCKGPAAATQRLFRRQPAGAPARAQAGPLIALCLLAPLCGCSQPLLIFQSEAAKPTPAAELSPEPTVTGSIAKRPMSFGADLGEEDWRRAHAALTVALDPQGNGRPVKWDNPESSLRGSVNPTGLPYVANDEICRDFLASVITPENSRFVRGTGCKLSGGSWELKRVRSAKDT